jgi:uncharacterized protein (TIGR03083 family)
MTPMDVPGSRLVRCLADEVDRLAGLAAGNLTVAVPACPGWDVGQLVRHVAHGLVDIALRQLRMPDPPAEHDLADEEPIAALRRCHAVFTGELGNHRLDEPVTAAEVAARFWLRRMTHETAVHRIDVELAIGRPAGPIEPDLAVDGVVEALSVFLDRETHSWREDYLSDLTEWGGRWLLVAAGTAGWRVTVRPEGVEVGSAETGDPDAVVRGEPVAVLLWLYDRHDDVLVEGDRALVAQVRRLLAKAMG